MYSIHISVSTRITVQYATQSSMFAQDLWMFSLFVASTKIVQESANTVTNSVRKLVTVQDPVIVPSVRLSRMDHSVWKPALLWNTMFLGNVSLAMKTVLMDALDRLTPLDLMDATRVNKRLSRNMITSLQSWVSDRFHIKHVYLKIWSSDLSNARPSCFFLIGEMHWERWDMSNRLLLRIC